MIKSAVSLAKTDRLSPTEHATNLIGMVCRLAGPFAFVDELRSDLRSRGIVAAVREHNDAALFDWLMGLLSFQGIADRVAENYIRDHGNVGWSTLRSDLTRRPSCGKLGGYWLFHSCGYEKGSGHCNEPLRNPQCPLPRHPLRNGRLNQTAYSLFMFMRDVALGVVITRHPNASERANCAYIVAPG